MLCSVCKAGVICSGVDLMWVLYTFLGDLKTLWLVKKLLPVFVLLCYDSASFVSVFFQI